MFWLIVLFRFPLFLCLRELKFDMVVSSSVVLVRALTKLPGGIGRFLPCGDGSHMSRLRHLGWNQCSHGLTSRPSGSCHHQCLQAVCEVLGNPKGSASELLDGTLKLPHCTTIFPCAFSPWSLPRVGHGGGKRLFFITGHHLDECGLPERHVLVFLHLVSQIQSIQRRGEGKDCAKEWGARRACLAIFFLDLGLGDFALGTSGTCLRREQA